MLYSLLYYKGAIYHVIYTNMQYTMLQYTMPACHPLPLVRLFMLSWIHSSPDKAMALPSSSEIPAPSSPTPPHPSAVLHVYICLYNRADIDDICVCLYLFISDLACLYNGMFISGYRRLYLDMDLYICSYNRHI